MFSEISREDIFRLETRRLWLRWPEVADIATGTPEAEAGDPRQTVSTVTRQRAENAAGTALHLALTGQGVDRRAIGIASLAPVRGLPEDCGLKLRIDVGAEHRGQGLATEAVQAMVDAAFLLSGTPLVAASSRVLDPAFRRVLEKCGFAACGTGLDPSQDGRGLAASDRFRLDRKVWISLKGWRVPFFPRPPAAVAGAVLTG